jgi:hypothetical protein
VEFLYACLHIAASGNLSADVILHHDRGFRCPPVFAICSAPDITRVPWS